MSMLARFAARLSFLTFGASSCYPLMKMHLPELIAAQQLQKTGN
jgi:hypothetical protein